MLRIAICDDQEVAAAVIATFLKDYFDALAIEYEIVEYSNGEALVDDYKDGVANYQLAFLDIIMNGITGIEVARHIRELDLNVKLVFTTSSSDYILEGYDVFAFGYLLKPLDVQKLEYVCEQFLKTTDDINKKSISIKSQRKTINLFYRDIIFVESNNTSLIFHTKDGSIYRTYGKLTDVQERLNDDRFLRCHQSYIVNMRYIRECNQDFIMITNDIVPIRKKEKKMFSDLYLKYIRG